ncbi:WD repeat-containing protein 54 isoform X1 [Hydra vulgaris]|uniref:WD repeat-containing protein 54 n=1 Tax=Hydra vulgaris TaxID=6087 RepID=T2M5E7_HYDVU|nr:WD repeat-containing protein 54 [Hydra vulgaris]
MYKKVSSLPIKSSASLLYNNFDVVKASENNDHLFAVVHKSIVWVFDPSQSKDEKGFTNTLCRKVICKGESMHDSAIILQAKWCVLATRTLLVIASVKGVQMFEADGSIMLFWQALGTHRIYGHAQYARGVTAVGEKHICIGVADGSILVFDIPNKGTTVKLHETLLEHRTSITDLHSHSSSGNMISGDEEGNIIVWKAGGHFTKLIEIMGFGFPCSSIRLWKTMVIGGYGSGHIRIFNAVTGKIIAEITAHAKWINAIDVAEDSGLLLSSSEDSFIRVWDLNKMVQIDQILVENSQITGARFIDNSGDTFGLTAFDSNQVLIYSV